MDIEPHRLPLPVLPLPAVDAPKDGSMICVLVDHSTGHGALEDSLMAWTIGFNTLADTGEDLWILSGWNWEQDCFSSGEGEVIGWAPLPQFSIPTEAAD